MTEKYAELFITGPYDSPRVWEHYIVEIPPTTVKLESRWDNPCFYLKAATDAVAPYTDVIVRAGGYVLPTKLSAQLAREGNFFLVLAVDGFIVGRYDIRKST